MTKTTGYGRGRGQTPTTRQRRRATQCRTELAEIIAHGLANHGDDWPDHAACKDLHDDTLFPDALPDSALYAQQVEAAKAICATCPVRRQCLEHALVAGEDHGVWGGLDERERRAARRATRRTQKLQPTGAATASPTGEEAA